METAQDILEELRLPGSAPTAAPSVAAESNDPLLAALGFDPVTLDPLVARTGNTAAELNVRLLDLEMDGHVARRPGQRFQRVGR